MLSSFKQIKQNQNRASTEGEEAFFASSH